MVKKLLLIIFGFLVAFICGMQYENTIAKDQCEMISAILITTNAYDNFVFQRKLYIEMQQDIQGGNLDKLQSVISQQIENIDYMIQIAETFCEREECTNETREYLKTRFRAYSKDHGQLINNKYD